MIRSWRYSRARSLMAARLVVVCSAVAAAGAVGV
jgi:hypothetical protein